MDFPVHETHCQGIQATIVRRAAEKSYRSILLNSKETEAIAISNFPKPTWKQSKYILPFLTINPYISFCFLLPHLRKRGASQKASLTEHDDTTAISLSRNIS